MKILFIADIFGSPGRNAVRQVLPDLIRDRKIDFIIANTENAAGGRGPTVKVCDELFGLGIDVMTSGNHIWDQKEIIPYISEHPRLVRPANYPKEQPGKGSVVAKSQGGIPVGVINIEGQLFIGRTDCPFRSVDEEIKNIIGKTKIIVVDLHAEASSEKRGMGWHLDGRVTAVIGTHTHIPTADAEILPQGTAYITDVGMTGPHDSVIGLDKEVAKRKLYGHFPEKMKAAEGGIRFQGALIEADENSGRAISMERIEIPV